MLIPRARLVGYVLAGCLALGVVCGWPRHASDAGWEAYAHAIGAAHARQMAADEKALGESRARVTAADGTTTRAIHTYNVIRYRTDTLPIHDTAWVKVFVERADSVVRACTELQNACAVYRVRAESVIADLHVENDALRAEVKAIHGSRIVNLWSKVRVPLAFGAGIYLGAKAVR